ncbi:MAG: L-seryl-tRNA(Sec) selenium transferase [Gammaproteobacteria bacterium]|nr:L-seryl-tRNA(Sec) selenium transferase [Gammaproteobacteria bacterium]
MTVVSDLYKLLPSVDTMLQQAELVRLLEKMGKAVVKTAIQTRLDIARQQIAGDDEDFAARLRSPNFDKCLAADIAAGIEQEFTSTLRPVFNLTGTVIHTNLGRSRFPPEAVSAMEMAANECINLEFDLASGKRGDRDSHIEAAICDICGAEAATVVNNNAAAVLLVLSTFAFGREVLISRGELVEIGGSFRIPEVMQSAGCKLREVGTTNRTHLKDFASAIDDNTALIMKVHTSNYEIRGFTESVPESALHELAGQHGIPFVSDLGSGTLVELTRFGLPKEPTVSSELLRGADLVTFSGDKLLGGPQAGIIVGRRDLVDQLKKNPLKRALRIDKITLVALVAVINLYRDPERIGTRLPALSDLTRPLAEIEYMATQVEEGVRQALTGLATVTVEPCKSQIGSGSLPTELLDSMAIVCTPQAAKGKRDAALVALAKAFRALPRPVIGRVHDGRLLLDCRCLRDYSGFLEQLQSIALDKT